MKMTRTFTACAIFAGLNFNLMAMQCDMAEAKANETSGAAVKIAQDLWSNLVKIATQQEIDLDNGIATDAWFSLVEEAASAYDAALFKEIRIHVLNKYLALAARLINSKGYLPDADKKVICGLEKMMKGIKPEFYRFVGETHGAVAEANAKALFDSWAGPTLYLYSFIPNVLMEIDCKNRFPVVFACMQRYIVLLRDFILPTVRTPHEEQTMNGTFINEIITRDLVTKDFEFFKGTLEFAYGEGGPKPRGKIEIDNLNVLEDLV
ncbi:MAG: hypothetical protein WCW33_00530 [Candidatus Babeliales bacterium]|jgi:hypothetical protein